MGAENQPLLAPTASGWLANELGELTATMRLVGQGKVNRTQAIDRLLAQVLIHVALMEEIVYPALAAVQARTTHGPLHAKVRQAADAAAAEHSADQPQSEVLVQATADLIAYEACEVASVLRSLGPTEAQIGAQLSRRQEELITTGPAR